MTRKWPRVGFAARWWPKENKEIKEYCSNGVGSGVYIVIYASLVLLTFIIVLLHIYVPYTVIRQTNKVSASNLHITRFFLFCISKQQGFVWYKNHEDNDRSKP